MLARFKHFRVVLVLGVLGCSPTLEQVCSNEAPALQKEIAVHQAWLAAELSSSKGRAIASVGAPSEAEQERDQENRDRMQAWALDRLQQIQRAIDLTEETRLRPARAVLSDLSNEIVGFYGYAGEGKWDRAQTLLNRIETKSAQISKLACGGK